MAYYPLLNPNSDALTNSLFVEAIHENANQFSLKAAAPHYEGLGFAELEFRVVGGVMTVYFEGSPVELSNDAAKFDIHYLPTGVNQTSYATFDTWVTHNLASMAMFMEDPYPRYVVGHVSWRGGGTGLESGWWRRQFSDGNQYPIFIHRSGDSSTTDNGGFFIGRMTTARTIDIYVTSGSLITLSVMGFIS